MNLLQGKNIHRFIQIDLIVLAILLYLFRATIPFLKFPFLILFIVLVIYSFINYRNQLLSTLKEFFRNNYLSIFLAIILIFSFFLSNKLYLIIFKDIFNAIILLCLFFLLTLYIKTTSDLNLFIKKLIRLIVFFALLISVRLFISFMDIYPGADKLSSNMSILNSLVSSLSFDYNFALLSVIFGMVSIIYSLSEAESLKKKALLNLTLIFFSITILFSGSLRGLFTLSTIIIILIVVQLVARIRKTYSSKTVGYNSEWFLVLIFVLIFLLFGFIFMVPVNIKRNTLNTFGINIRTYKHVVSTRLYKYSTIFSDQDYRSFQHIIWPEKTDPRYPDSGWGSRPSTQVFPLTGENVKIVPVDAVGYRMDKTCDASAWTNNAYSYTNISSLFLSDSIPAKDEFYYASVFCFVSKDFDGTWAHISAEGEVSGKTIQEYDLKRKGEWQKISIFFKNKSSLAPVYLYWAKNGVADFSSLKGYIIFAYPQYKMIKANSLDPSSGWGSRVSSSVMKLTGLNFEIVPEGSIGYKMDSASDASTWSNNAYSFTNITVLFQSAKVPAKGDAYRASVYCFVSKDFDGTWARISAEGRAIGNTINEYDLTKKGIWQKLQIDFSSDFEIPPVYLYWSKYGIKDFSSLKGYIIFAYPQYETVTLNSGISSDLKYPEKRQGRVLRPNDFVEIDKYHSSFTLKGQHNNIIKYGCANSDIKDEFNPIFRNTLCVTSFNSGLCRREFYISGIKVYIDLFSNNIDKDPIRRWAAKFISEDTTYYPLHNLLTIDTISNKMLGPRLMRWQFAMQIYRKEYNLKQKLLGGGFSFLNWFGYKFMKDKTLSDYPHNPLLSILLYSGIIGLFIYLFFFYKVIYYYFRYFKEYTMISIYFVITLFFSFFSAGSPFDPPIMGFFALLPFFIHNIQKNRDYPNLLPNE